MARDVWGSTHENGTVPTASIYTSHNAWSAPYVDSPAIFEGMADLIRSARHEADLETYEWGPTVFARGDVSASGDRWGTDPTTVIMDALTALQARLQADSSAPTPVRVRFVIDGSASAPMEKMKRLSRQLQEIALDPRYVDVRIATHTKLVSGALHSKLLVVDGYKAILTGANPQSQQGLLNHWHDTGYLVKGEIGIGLQGTFDDTWSEADEASCMDDNCASLGKTQFAHDAAVSAPRLDSDPDLRGACTPILAATRRAFGPANPLLPPENVDNPQDRAFLSMMVHAKQILKMESPNLNDTHAKNALLAAAGRGLDVRVILSLGFNSAAERGYPVGAFGHTVDLAGGSNEDSVAELYRRAGKSGVCANLHIRWNPMRDGSRPSWGNEVPGASHTKYLTVDGAVAMVGSANHDLTSWQLIRETNVVIDSATVTARYDAAVFDHDWEIAFDVVTWAKDVQAGRVVAPEGVDLDALLGGSAQEWAAGIVTACGG